MLNQIHKVLADRANILIRQNQGFSKVLGIIHNQSKTKQFHPEFARHLMQTSVKFHNGFFELEMLESFPTALLSLKLQITFKDLSSTIMCSFLKIKNNKRAQHSKRHKKTLEKKKKKYEKNLNNDNKCLCFYIL